MCVEFNSPDNFWAIYLRKKHLDLFGLLLFTDMGTGVSRNTEMSKGHHQNVVQNMVHEEQFGPRRPFKNSTLPTNTRMKKSSLLNQNSNSHKASNFEPFNIFYSLGQFSHYQSVKIENCHLFAHLGQQMPGQAEKISGSNIGQNIVLTPIVRGCL